MTQSFDQPFFPGIEAASNSRFGTFITLNEGVIMVPAPAPGKYRKIENITIHNHDTSVANHTFIIGIVKPIPTPPFSTLTYIMDRITNIDQNNTYHAKAGVVQRSTFRRAAYVVPVVLKAPDEAFAGICINNAIGANKPMWTVHWSEPT